MRFYSQFLRVIHTRRFHRRIKEVEQKSIEEEANKRIEELVAKRVEEVREVFFNGITHLEV